MDPKGLLDNLLFASNGVFSAKGDELLVAGSNGDVRFYDVASGKESRVVKVAVSERQFGTVYVTASPSGKHFAVLSNGLQVTVCDWASGKGLYSLTFPGQSGMVTISPDGRTLAVLVGNKVTFVEIATAKTRLTLDLPIASKQLTYSPDGRRFATAMQDTTALVWDLAALVH